MHKWEPPQPGNSFHMKANLSGNGVTAMAVRQLQKYIEQWIMMFVLQGVCVRGSLWLWIMGLPHGNCLLDKLTFLELVNWRLCHQCPAGRVFQHQIRYWIKYRVGFGSGRSVEKYDRVFPVIFFSFGYFRVIPGVCRFFSGISGFTHIYLGYFLTFNEGWKDCNKPNWF